MRTVAAVLALIACVHAGLWVSLRTKESSPNFTGQLASVSYAPFVNASNPDSDERPTPEQIRATIAKFLTPDHAITIVTKPSDTPHRPHERGHGRVEPHDDGGGR